MLDVQTVIGLVAVTELEEAVAWYERLFGRPADRRSMEGEVAWLLTSAGGVQVVRAQEHAGSSFLTLGVDDLDRTLADVATRDLHPESETVGELDDAPLRMAKFQDPAGNTVVLASQNALRDLTATPGH